MSSGCRNLIIVSKVEQNVQSPANWAERMKQKLDPQDTEAFGRKGILFGSPSPALNARARRRREAKSQNEGSIAAGRWMGGGVDADDCCLWMWEMEHGYTSQQRRVARSAWVMMEKDGQRPCVKRYV